MCVQGRGGDDLLMLTSLVKRTRTAHAKIWPAGRVSGEGCRSDPLQSKIVLIIIKAFEPLHERHVLTHQAPAMGAIYRLVTLQLCDMTYIYL